MDQKWSKSDKANPRTHKSIFTVLKTVQPYFVAHNNRWQF